MNTHTEAGVAPVGSEPRARVPPLAFPKAETAPAAQDVSAPELVAHPQQPPKPKPQPPAPATAKAFAPGTLANYWSRSQGKGMPVKVKKYFAKDNRYEL